MSKIVIKVENLSKRYLIGTHQADTLAEQATNWLKHPFGFLNNSQTQEFWALKNVSFNVEEGEVLGIIGRNGSGKSTLLKILSRITHPTSGEARIRGRVSSLLEVGTGFNPELTGRENIFLNGAILGMSRKEIKNKFDEIVDFSGVEQFIDTPVKRYSSGMYVRLAFSVAAHLDCDILLVDEVLAVGDLKFQKKCIGSMKNIAKSGKTILFVSHDMSSINNLCTRAIYLAQGEKKLEDSTLKVTKEYIRDVVMDDFNEDVFIGPLKDRVSFSDLRINNQPPSNAVIKPSDKIAFSVKVKTKEPFRTTFTVFKDGQRVFTAHDIPKAKQSQFGVFISKVIIPKYILRPGEYVIGMGGHGVEGSNWLFSSQVGSFAIESLWDTKNEISQIGVININYSGNREEL